MVHDLNGGFYNHVRHLQPLCAGAKQSACRANLDLHSRSQRHHLHVTRLEHPDEISPPTLQTKRHVIVSLMQDYRHGAVTANSLLIPIGFCVYKVRVSCDRQQSSGSHRVLCVQGESCDWFASGSVCTR